MKLSEETKRKMSEAAKRRWAKKKPSTAVRRDRSIDKFNAVLYATPPAVLYSPIEQTVYDAWQRLGNLSAHDLHMAWLAATVYGPGRAVRELEAKSADIESV